MLATREAVNQIKRSKPENVENALIWVITTLCFGLMPLLLTVLGLAVVQQCTWANIRSLLCEGELLMVSNAVVGAACLLIGKDRSANDRFAGRTVFIFIATMLLIPTAFLFGALRIFRIDQHRDASWPVLVFMCMLFIVGCVYSFFVVLLDDVATPKVDVERAFEHDQERIKKALKRDTELNEGGLS